jgi:hypothetical protein
MMDVFSESGSAGAIRRPQPRGWLIHSRRFNKGPLSMSNGWEPISTAPKNDDRVLVAGGTWIRGNRQRIPQSFPCLVVWDETEWLICDNEGIRSVIHGPKYWMAIPALD